MISQVYEQSAALRHGRNGLVNARQGMETSSFEVGRCGGERVVRGGLYRPDRTIPGILSAG